MRGWTDFIRLICIAVTCLNLCYGQGDVPRPTFPDAFQVEVQGIFMNEDTEVDGTLYYDKKNNRAAVSYTYQGEFTFNSFFFKMDQLVSVQGTDCDVSKIPDVVGASFFPYTTDDTGKKFLADPEEILYFKQSVLDRQELSVFPSYIYTAKIDFPQYGRHGCDVTHIFSKPEIQTPDCESHSCRSTLVSINVKCLNDKREVEVDHTYNFFRFRSGVPESVFQVPVGVFCDINSRKHFPTLPEYFSFAYSLVDEQKGIDDPGVFPVYKKIWYDAKLRLVRIDEYDDDGLIMSSRIFDFYGGVAYTIIGTVAMCQGSPINEEMSLDEMTTLPRIIFKKDVNLDDTVYIGTRNVHNMDYEVWSMSWVDEETDARIVEEFYFSKILPKVLNRTTHLQLSHVEIFTSERNDESSSFELSQVSLLSIYNFRTKPKEWEAFDISSCFEHDQKLFFQLKVNGPAVLKSTYVYEELLGRLYTKLIIATNVSVIRISELAGKFDGIHITEFNGWILDKSDEVGSESRQHEPNMTEAAAMIQIAADAGSLNLKLTRNGQVLQYEISNVEKNTESTTVPSTTPETTGTPPKRDCFSGGSLAAASIILLIVGMGIGSIGYYVFLKKRKPAQSDKVKLSEMM